MTGLFFCRQAVTSCANGSVVQLPPCPKELEAQTRIFPARLPNPLIEPADFCKSMSPKCAIRGKGKGSLVSVLWLAFS